MSDAEAIEIFLRTVTSAVRSAPLRDALGTLRGLLLLAEERPEVAVIQSIYTQLTTVDDQLELIASGQMKLPLDPTPANRDGDGADGGDGSGQAPKPPLPPHGPHGEPDL